MAEQRRAVREKTYKAGRIAFSGRRAEIFCLVRNLSATGACLGFDGPTELPDAFNLVFDSGEPSRMCRVVWRKEKRIGVEFQ